MSKRTVAIKLFSLVMIFAAIIVFYPILVWLAIAFVMWDLPPVWPSQWDGIFRFIYMMFCLCVLCGLTGKLDPDKP